ncbi:MAG: hypothetical protein WAM94_17205, partial [Chromatiaceae bacterium]
MALSDGRCTGAGQCVVFSGQAQACKRAVGGIVNCCTTPEGIPLANCLDLVFALGRGDGAIMGHKTGSGLRGSWETLRQPVTSTWSAVKGSFISVANNLLGNPNTPMIQSAWAAGAVPSLLVACASAACRPARTALRRVQWLGSGGSGRRCGGAIPTPEQSG